MFSRLLFHVKLMVTPGRGWRAGTRCGPGVASRRVGLARPVAGLLLPVALFSAAAGAFGACAAFCPRALSWRAEHGPVLPPVACRWRCGGCSAPCRFVVGVPRCVGRGSADAALCCFCTVCRLRRGFAIGFLMVCSKPHDALGRTSLSFALNATMLLSNPHDALV